MLGNWLGQVVFAFRIGYRDGSALRPGTRPEIFKALEQQVARERAIADKLSDVARMAKK